MMGLSVRRAELARIIEEASVDCAESSREKLRKAAAATDAVAVGWFHCDGVGCPARQARYRHQGFQRRYDTAMFDHFGRDYDEWDSFVVRVVD